MPIFIGGSGSTGSSLLRQILNRNDQVYISNESHLFCKASLYRNWSKSNHRLLLPSIFGLKSTGVNKRSGIDGQNAGIAKAQVKACLKSSDSFSSFGECLYRQSYKLEDHVIWGDKTPANCFFLDALRAIYPEAKLVLCVRHPQDVIASLVNRGKTIEESTAQYLSYTSVGLSVDDIFICRYEDLINPSEQTVKDLCAYLDIEFQEKMCSSAPSSEKITRIKGWNYDESQDFKVGSNPSFDKLDDETKALINACIRSLRIDSLGQGNQTNTYTHIEAICNKLSYTLRESSLINSEPNFALKNIQMHPTELQKNFSLDV